MQRPSPQDNLLRTFQIRDLTPDSVTDFDLFASVGGHMLIYAPKPYSWRTDEIDRLRSEGYQCLFYLQDCQGDVSHYKNLTQMAFPERTEDKSAYFNALMDHAADLTRLLVSDTLSQSSVHEAGKVISEVIELLAQDLSLIRTLDQLRSHDHYVFYHSARVSAYAIALAMKMLAPSKQKLHELGVATMFHDVGKLKIPQELLNKKGRLNDTERALLDTHPELGFQITRDVLPGHLAEQVIRHHHETMDGQGYPSGLSKNELLPEVRIVQFADIFDALTTARPYRISRSKFEALAFIKHTLKGKVDPKVFSAMVSLLKN